MKKLFTLFTVAFAAVNMNAQMISFTEGELLDSWTVDGFVLDRSADTDVKNTVDANTCYFGTAESQVKFEARLKTGGKSSSTKNYFTLTIPSDGTVNIYARTGSNSATDRNVVLTQGETEVVNKILLEEEKIMVMIDEEEKSVYPVVSAEVTAGTATVTYPVGSINFYGFEFVAGGTTSIESVEASADAVVYNILGQKVAEGTKGLVICNGKKMVLR